MNERKYHLLNFKSNSISERHIAHPLYTHRLFPRSNFLHFSFERINALKFVPSNMKNSQLSNDKSLKGKLFN